MPRKSAYSIDLNVKEGHEGYHVLVKSPPPVGMKALQQQEKALQSGSSGGRPGTAAVLTQTQQKALAAKRKQKAMAVAMKPGQQIAMNAFMMYMSGSQLNIFSISITSMAILSPLGSIFSLESTFGPLQQQQQGGGGSGGSTAASGEDSLQMPKFIFIALNLVWLAMGLYKMSSMRLLPTTSADWTSKIVWKEMMETTSIPPDSMIF